MKNKFLTLTLLTVTILALASCGSSRSGYNSSHKKGYGCPATSFTPSTTIEKNKI